MKTKIKSDFLFTIFLIIISTHINGQIKDIDGNIYKTVEIGSQVWMAENLKVSRLNDGTRIAKIEDSYNWCNTVLPAYCFYDNNSNSSFGGLYNFYSVETGKLCPIGWHVPNNYEWKLLIDFIGDDVRFGEKTKAKYSWDGNDSWCYSKNGKDIFGLSILRSGVRGAKGEFLRNGATFWTKDQSNYYFHCTESMSKNDELSEFLGYSVRCVKDNQVLNNKSALLNDFERFFSMNCGDLIEFLSLKKGLELDNIKFVSSSEVILKNKNGVSFHLKFTDSSLNDLDSLIILVNNADLNLAIENAIKSETNFKKLTVDDKTIHYYSEKFNYILQETVIDNYIYYMALISTKSK